MQLHVSVVAECKFRCSSGQCIWDLTELCDGVAHCDDFSDELRSCSMYQLNTVLYGHGVCKSYSHVFYRGQFLHFRFSRRKQWRRQLVGTWARAPPLAFQKKFCYTLKQVVQFGLVLCQTLNLALFVQPYSLWNDTITGYNGAYAKVNVVFTARRYALARSLLSSGVRPSVVHHVRALYPDG